MKRPPNPTRPPGPGPSPSPYFTRPHPRLRFFFLEATPNMFVPIFAGCGGCDATVRVLLTLVTQPSCNSTPPPRYNCSPAPRAGRLSYLGVRVPTVATRTSLVNLRPREACGRRDTQGDRLSKALVSRLVAAGPSELVRDWRFFRPPHWHTLWADGC